jgi:hypothetical protein
MARTVTARSLIVGTMRLLGVTAQGEEPSSAEMLEAFDRLNEMVDSWATQRLTMQVVSRSQYDLVAGQATYTIGPTGTVPTPDWIGARPESVDLVTLLLSYATPETELPLGALTEMAYQAIQQKTLENSQPTAVYYEATMPSGTFSFWPVPNTAINPVIVYAPQALAQFAALTTSYVMAPGYVTALRYNLAKMLAPEYGKALTAEIAMGASDALGDIKRLNVPMMDLGFDPGLLPHTGRYGYNINTDQ